MNEYNKEQLMTKYLKDNNYFDKLYPKGYEIVYDKERQLKGIDLVTKEYGNVDIKNHFYNFLNMFLELSNPQEYENSYLVEKETDNVQYNCVGENTIYMIPYEKLYKLAIEVDKWLKDTNTKPIRVYSGTTGIIVPMKDLEQMFDIRPVLTFRRPFRLGNEPLHIGEHKKSSEEIWEKFKSVYTK